MNTERLEPGWLLSCLQEGFSLTDAQRRAIYAKVGKLKDHRTQGGRDIVKSTYRTTGGHKFTIDGRDQVDLQNRLARRGSSLRLSMAMKIKEKRRLAKS